MDALLNRTKRMRERVTSGPPKFGPKSLDKMARVDRLIRLGLRVTDACKTVGMTVRYYRKLKSLYRAPATAES